MRDIQLLSAEVRDQIAAGEVVERPASVVKELVENSLDAGATKVTVWVEKGGKKLIKIVDNGHGMTPQNAQMAITRHATSKITTAADLFSLGSFGFRGEALAAVAAVSDFRLETATATAESGTCLTRHGGGEVEVTPCPPVTGTLVSVRDLFLTVPARLQYLKAEATEYRHILRTLTAFGLDHPTVEFRLHHNGKQTLHLPAGQTLHQRLTAIVPPDTTLLRVEARSQLAAVSGWVSAPGSYARSRRHQWLSVQQRAVTDTRVSYCVRQTYLKTCGIEKHLHPVWCLQYAIDPLMVDVNVHPRKTEVTFAEPEEIWHLTQDALTTALTAARDQTFTSPPSTVAHWPTPPAGPSSISGNPASSAPRPASTGGAPARPSRRQVAASHHFWSSFAAGHTARDTALSQQGADHTTPTTHPPPHEPTAQGILSDLQFITQLERKYLLASNHLGLVVLDQHAVHERILFDQFWAERRQQDPTPQSLLTPHPVHRAPSEVQLLRTSLPTVAQLGFTVAEAPTGALHLTAVPTDMAQHDAESLLDQLLDHLQAPPTAEDPLTHWRRTRTEYRACRAAVKFGDALTPAAAQNLLDALPHTQWGHLCPHGRPVYHALSYHQLNAQFHR